MKLGVVLVIAACGACITWHLVNAYVSAVREKVLYAGEVFVALEAQHAFSWAGALVSLLLVARFASLFARRPAPESQEPQTAASKLLSLFDKWWEPIFKWTLSVLILGFLGFFFASMKERRTKEDEASARRAELTREASVRRAELTKSTFDALAQFRGALLEFASDCLAQSFATHRGPHPVLVDPLCSATYARVVDGWTQATWVLPRFVREIVQNDCDGPLVSARACVRLSGQAALAPASLALRRFVRAYARYRSGSSQDPGELLDASQALFVTTRNFGCAALLAGSQFDLPTCYCTRLMLEESGALSQLDPACREPQNGMHVDGTEVDELRLDELTKELESRRSQ